MVYGCIIDVFNTENISADWADLQAFYTSIMDVGSHGRVSLSDAATWFGIEFDESTGHAHSALADARVTAKLFKQVMDGDYRVSPRAQEVRQRWGIGERAQTRLSSKCPELGDLLLKLKAEGGVGGQTAIRRCLIGGPSGLARIVGNAPNAHHRNLSMAYYRL